MEVIDINWLNLALGSLLLIIPVFILLYYRTGLVKPMLIAFARMAGQLALVGLYLKYIFELNSVAVNMLWVVIMIFTASLTIISRSELKKKYFFVPMLVAIIVDVLLNGSIFAFVIIGTDYFFDARYFIPVVGMIIGNVLNSTIVGTRSFYKSLEKDNDRFRFHLMCGATSSEALFPFASDAMKDAFSPAIASTATIGLIWLPGMMTGQILGGSDPITAIKYQIIIVIAIFVGSVTTVFISLFLSKKFVFDSYGRLNKDIFEKRKQLNSAK